jgi:hypothetical protein
MGNTKKNNSNTTNEKDNLAAADLPLIKQKRWGLIKSDLKEALNTWDKLEKKQAPLSQEEEQLVKIKSIINQLKEKLEQF